MKKKNAFLILFLVMFVSSHCLLAQVRTAFSGEADKFTTELTSFMGQNLKPEQLTLLNSFVSSWDSTFFSSNQKEQIMAISNNMVSKRMRPSPHIISYLGTIMSFINYDVNENYLSEWFTGLGAFVADAKSPISQISNFINSTGLLITDSILYSSRSATWKVQTNKFRFQNDSVFKIIIPETDLMCFTSHDTTYIKETEGIYIPSRRLWDGTKGKVTWEKAGYKPEEVFVLLEDYKLDISKSSFTFDSVLFTNTTYFESPVLGVVSDRIISTPNPESATFPRFETYQKAFSIDNIYENINFKGGLVFEGASVRGTGDRFTPSSLEMFKNDTLYVKLKSSSFIFNKETIRSQSTVFSIYLNKDSIYHSDIAFTYYVPTRELNTYRSRFPTSKSPYFSSYHQMDMYFEYLSWKLNESTISLSRARGASMGQAYFESASFFNENEFFRLMGMDDEHPLHRISSFADYWYTKTFPINEFAKWMKQSPEYATALCIDLANKGFLYFDRSNDEVTIKQKLYDYIDSYAKKKDYDVISILSETQAPLDNAVLDMRNYKMRINGIPRIFLSDSQNVAIYPYDNSIVLEKIRSFEFDGVVQAGMITVFGNDFKFNYDTFKIKLTAVDSIALSVYTEERDEFGGLLAKNIEDLIQMTNAELLIDNPLNKSGLQSLDQYPIFTALSESYIFYDKIPDLEGVYPQSEFYFKLDPFAFENTDRLNESDLTLTGEFIAGNIMPPSTQTLSLRNDKSLGFLYEIEDEGIPIYGGKGVMHNEITMSNSGLKGHGQINHLTASVISAEVNMFPDSVITRAETFTLASNTLYPEIYSENIDIRWYPEKDEWYAQQADKSKFSMFDNGSELDGSLLLTSNGLSGSGSINFTDSRLISDKYSFTNNTISADTASYNLNSISGDGFAFIAEDANTFVDFNEQLSRFSLNTDKSLVKFPEINYICTMTDFEYDMSDKILSMTQRGRESSTLMSASELLKQDMQNLEKPTFFSTNMVNDTITFSATSGRYLLEEEKIIAEDVNYIKVADALIQPDKGVLKINKGAKFDKLNESLIAINNRHLIHTAQVNIIRTTRYEASGIYDYIDENNNVQAIKFNEITVDSLKSKGSGYIPQTQNFGFSPYFTFQGDVHLRAEKEHLNFLGSSAIVHDCDYIGSAPMKFNSDIDPLNIMIPVSDKPRDINGNLITNGTYITIDSTHIYSAFLSPGKAWSDIALVSANGWLIYDKVAGKYKIASKEKLANTKLPGSLITFDKLNCDVYSEGLINLGLDYGLLKINSAGHVNHTTDSALIELDAIMALDFHFSVPALTVMSDEIRFMAGLEGVDLSSDAYNRAMQDLIGKEAAATLKEDMDLFGMARSLPADFNPKLILNDLKLVWNDEYR
ncbi:MAG: hypothetical protein QNK33_09495, partial [Bacteroidales bacterium]|nr:hypothetical protein [Bacteroidales bacterium]